MVSVGTVAVVVPSMVTTLAGLTSIESIDLGRLPAMTSSRSSRLRIR